MSRRGFTLVEILVAVGILLMIVALVGPALFEQIAPRSFDYTADRLAGEIRLAREDARRTGEITLVYATADAETGRWRIETRLRPPEDGLGGKAFGASGGFGGAATANGSGRSRSAGTARSGQTGGPSQANGNPFAADRDRDTRLLFTLPDGYRVTAERPLVLAADTGFGDTLTADAADEIGGIEPRGGARRDPFDTSAFGPGGVGGMGGLPADGEPLLLAVCVPDGTVLPAGPAWIVDPDDRVAELVIESASGVIACERVAGDREETAMGNDPFADPALRSDRGPTRRNGGTP